MYICSTLRTRIRHKEFWLISHDNISWTANCLAGPSYRYAYLKKTGTEPRQIEIVQKRAGEVDVNPFRWIGEPGHHNYCDVIHSLGQYYTSAAEGKEKDRAGVAIDTLVSYWVDNDLKIAKYDRSLPAAPILGFTNI